MKVVRIGWIMLLVSGFLLLAGGGYGASTAQGMLFLLFLTAMTLLGLLFSQIILVWHYRAFFKQLRGTFLAVGFFFLGLFVFSQQSLATSDLMIVELLYLLISGWLVSYMLVIGFILAIHLYYRDHSVLFIGLILLIYAWAMLIYISRVGAENTLVDLMSVEGSSFLLSLSCLAIWIIPLGIVSFFWHAAKILRKEWKAEDPHVVRSSGE